MMQHDATRKHMATSLTSPTKIGSLTDFPSEVLFQLGRQWHPCQLQRGQERRLPGAALDSVAVSVTLTQYDFSI